MEKNLFETIKLIYPTHSDGEGIKIGVFDSGVDDHYPSLKKALIYEKDYLTQPHNLSLANNHGTKVAGILIGDEMQITGAVPKADILSFRVIKDNQYTDNKAIINALTDIIDNSIEIDIINMSLSINTGFIPSIQPLIDKLTTQGTIIIVAGGIFGSHNEICELQNVIHIGVFEETQFMQIKSSGLPPEYRISFLNTPILTTSFSNSVPDFENFINDSAYTAIMTGIIAGYLSYYNIPKNERVNKIDQFINNNSKPIRAENSINQLIMYK